MSIPSPILAHFPLLSSSHTALIQELFHLHQDQLFTHWADPTKDLALKIAFLNQLEHINKIYPGGIKQYIENAKKLLKDSKNNTNPFENYVPEIPTGERLDTSSAAFLESEKLGMSQLYTTCFVLVAGGLGERLGYNGIKIELSIDTVTNDTFIKRYIDSILAIQERGRLIDNSLIIPLCIMTSDDTNEATINLLKNNNYYGMLETQITIVKQELVPALQDADARFVCDGYNLVLKPHGHGDVHVLLHQSGLVKKWKKDGKKWVVFFQDTNGLVFHSLPAALGVSIKHNFAVNSLTVARKPGEAVGGICTLKHTNGSKLTVNVEYNQLAPLLKATVNPLGDVADETGFSPYPGNINVLLFELNSYAETLERTSGSVPEFVNPKYKNAEKTIFTPTRLECMMQDYPKLLDSSAKVGFTQLDRWVSFSAVKNNLVDASKKQIETGFAECPASGEFDVYSLFRKKLQLAGAKIVEGPIANLSGINVVSGPAVVFSPYFAVTLYEFIEKLKGSKISISANSVLYVEADCQINQLDLDGALVIKGNNLKLDSVSVKNNGIVRKDVDVNDQSVASHTRIRGYYFDISSAALIENDTNEVKIINANL